jgi:hypothetical protein
MPKRTNNFQKLVFLVKKHAADGATVTESKFLRDNITGTDREVDICIESTVAGHSVTVSIECRDHSRKASVQWVEEMKSKHERLSTNALVLISSSGFSKEAIAVAQTYGIETITLSAFDAASAERLFGNTSSLWSKVFTLSPAKVVVRVKPIGELPSENVVAFPDNLIYDHNGEELFDVKKLVEYLLHTEYVVCEFGKLGDLSHKSFEVRWEPANDPKGKPLCLQKLDPFILRPIEYVQITGSCSFEISEFPLKNGNLGGVRVAWASGEFLGKEALLVASENQTAVTKISITNENVSLESPIRR